MSYTPRDGSLPDKVIGTLDNSPLGTLLTVTQSAADFGVPRGNVTIGLKPAVKHGALFIGKQGGVNAYGLGPGTPAEGAPNPVATPAPLPATQWVAGPGTEIIDARVATSATLNSSITDPDAPQFALWCDGTLHLHGITPREDGVIELTLADTARLARLLHGFTFEQ